MCLTSGTNVTDYMFGLQHSTAYENDYNNKIQKVLITITTILKQIHFEHCTTNNYNFDDSPQINGQ